MSQGCCGHPGHTQHSRAVFGFISVDLRLSSLPSFLMWLPSVLVPASLWVVRKNTVQQGLCYHRWPEPLCSLDLIPLGSSAGKHSRDLCGNTLWERGQPLRLPCFHICRGIFIDMLFSRVWNHCGFKAPAFPEARAPCSPGPARTQHLLGQDGVAEVKWRALVWKMLWGHHPFKLVYTDGCLVCCFVLA